MLGIGEEKVKTDGPVPLFLTDCFRRSCTSIAVTSPILAIYCSKTSIVIDKIIVVIVVEVIVVVIVVMVVVVLEVARSF